MRFPNIQWQSYNQNEDQVIRLTARDFLVISDKARFFRAKVTLLYDQIFQRNDFKNSRNQGLLFSITKAYCLFSSPLIFLPAESLIRSGDWSINCDENAFFKPFFTVKTNHNCSTNSLQNRPKLNLTVLDCKDTIDVKQL